MVVVEDVGSKEEKMIVGKGLEEIVVAKKWLYQGGVGVRC
ncbi:8805_t:CDS:2 [Dentiscutata erythropus]|uniref:8805_t:CDS:1 n=1 Tax=Dentiscutata erythropus TaxID=1348616 RepID=A0A9N9PCZ7_9GLOM|nr:8805_t:CDS:2 [Dentiscutata erythropus]